MKTFKVSANIAGVPAMIPVQAEYFVLDHGHLCFRKSREGGGYPSSPAVFAPGAWFTVEELAEKAEKA